MNVFDYFFSETKGMNKSFLLNEGEDISFEELYRRSLALAHYLFEKLGENNKIVLISQNSLFFITCYLAIIKSGNVCVPLNPSIEQDNFSYIESLTQSELSFVSEKVKPNLIIKSEIIHESILEELINLLKKTSKDDKEVDSAKKTFDENRLAEILFTSGSTGVPKGVMLTHLNLRANTESILSYLKLTSDDSILLVLPLYYVYGLSIFHTHLKVGGSIALNNNFFLLGAVIDNLIKYECTGFAGVPSHFQMLLRISKTFKKSIFPQLRYVTQAGGKLHDAFIEEFTTAFPLVKFFVMYGQTEATARLAYLDPSMLKTKIGSIGKAIPGVTLSIVDIHGNPVAIGEIGEIVAKGDNIMKGYFNDPLETKEVLKNGWLFTGDLGKIDEDGFIFLTSRKKSIMKIGGQRISPKEIEEVIVSITDVIDCTVLSVEDEVLGESIKAKVVINEGGDEEDLRHNILKLCKQKLCHIKVPQIIDFSIKLNVNSSGKIMMT
ncbi:MAG: class I adenylate-forming enzyme family protein [Dysgonamonadaceae bacterium]|nr:class I adenylate-forming enzyme family protein [Dysgonamonadaceae bacterium]